MGILSKLFTRRPERVATEEKRDSGVATFYYPTPRKGQDLQMVNDMSLSSSALLAFDIMSRKRRAFALNRITNPDEKTARILAGARSDQLTPSARGKVERMRYGGRLP